MFLEGVFLHSNACFLDGGWKVMLGKERGLCTISGCSMHLSSACCPNSSGTMGEESPLSLLVVCAFFIFFLSVMVLEKAARGSDSVQGYRNEPSRHPRDPRAMKGDKELGSRETKQNKKQKETQQQ